MATDPTINPKDRIVKRAEREGLYPALQIGIHLAGPQQLIPSYYEKIPLEDFQRDFLASGMSRAPAVRNSPKGPDRSGSLPSIIQAAHLFPKTLFIYGTDLLQQHHRIPGKAAASGRKIDMGGQFGFILPAGDGSSDHQWDCNGCPHRSAQSVPDGHRPARSHHRAEIRIVYFTSFDSHAPSRSEFFHFRR